jgi:uncharacterized protein (DUF4415 family)
MKREYDFSKGRRGPVVSPGGRKQRITIRLDIGIIDHFKQLVLDAGGGNYQTLINDALRAHIAKVRPPLDEPTLRRVLREELRSSDD